MEDGLVFVDGGVEAAVSAVGVVSLLVGVEGPLEALAVGALGCGCCRWRAQVCRYGSVGGLEDDGGDGSCTAGD